MDTCPMEQKWNQISNRLHCHQERRQTTGKGQIVDEADSMKIQIPPQHNMPRLKNTAHNWKHKENPLETKNEEGWKDFNEEVQKLETEG